ncbi:GNAT domain-containing protein [Lophiotrema nucula]|uniref:GNAT domain-containing protein n=1 Tax=Lophiotrema nucula TaxID=690887 RepID=A0A6A5Z7R2_9PLEO|nr:GNAT domain-containing protein [Lophiotrema nucula]
MLPKIETERLILIKMTDTDEKSQHLQWFHKLWTDDAATSWAIHGKCKSFEDSRALMIEHMTTMDSITYAVFVKPNSTSTSTNDEEPGEHIGSIGFRTHDEIMHPPPPPPKSATEVSAQIEADITAPSPFNFRILGYSFFESSWGHGYATEALSALISAYSKMKAEENPNQLNYLEAGVSHENPASMRIVEKLGFEQVGWKSYPDPVWLGWPARWVYGGHWVYGKYV